MSPDGFTAMFIVGVLCVFCIVPAVCLGVLGYGMTSVSGVGTGPSALVGMLCCLAWLSCCALSTAISKNNETRA